MSGLIKKALVTRDAKSIDKAAVYKEDVSYYNL